MIWSRLSPSHSPKTPQVTSSWLLVRDHLLGKEMISLSATNSTRQWAGALPFHSFPTMVLFLQVIASQETRLLHLPSYDEQSLWLGMIAIVGAVRVIA